MTASCPRETDAIRERSSNRIPRRVSTCSRTSAASASSPGSTPQGDPTKPKTKWVPQDLGTVQMKVQGWTDFGFGMLSANSLQLAMYDALGRPKFTCALADETKTPRCR